MSHPASIRIAITTNDLVTVDASFASARQIVIYEVTAQDSSFSDSHQFRPGAKGKGGGKGKVDGQCWMMDGEADAATVDLNTAKLASLEGCAMLFSLGLGDVHALGIKSQGIFPVKMERPRDIPEVIEQVQRMLSATNPPLWMRRALAGARGDADLDAQVA